MKKLLLILGFVFMAAAVRAQDNGGLSQTSSDPIPPIDFGSGHQALFQPETTPITQCETATNSMAYATYL